VIVVMLHVAAFAQNVTEPALKGDVHL
jgi:hypothetical protein